jgi:hypothetical protein
LSERAQCRPLRRFGGVEILRLRPDSQILTHVKQLATVYGKKRFTMMGIPGRRAARLRSRRAARADRL